MASLSLFETWIKFDGKLNTRTEIPYRRAPIYSLYHSLLIIITSIIVIAIKAIAM